jgi:hypothetical protein
MRPTFPAVRDPGGIDVNGHGLLAARRCGTDILRKDRLAVPDRFSVYDFAVVNHVPELGSESFFLVG